MALHTGLVGVAAAGVAGAVTVDGEAVAVVAVDIETVAVVAAADDIAAAAESGVAGCVAVVECVAADDLVVG